MHVKIRLNRSVKLISSKLNYFSFSYVFVHWIMASFTNIPYTVMDHLRDITVIHKVSVKAMIIIGGSTQLIET